MFANITVFEIILSSQSNEVCNSWIEC